MELRQKEHEDHCQLWLAWGRNTWQKGPLVWFKTTQLCLVTTFVLGAALPQCHSALAVCMREKGMASFQDTSISQWGTAVLVSCDALLADLFIYILCVWMLSQIVHQQIPGPAFRFQNNIKALAQNKQQGNWPACYWLANLQLERWLIKSTIDARIFVDILSCPATHLSRSI